jgi:hypothetical protein
VEALAQHAAQGGTGDLPPTGGSVLIGYSGHGGKPKTNIRS